MCVKPWVGSLATLPLPPPKKKKSCIWCSFSQASGLPQNVLVFLFYPLLWQQININFRDSWLLMQPWWWPYMHQLLFLLHLCCFSSRKATVSWVHRGEWAYRSLIELSLFSILYFDLEAKCYREGNDMPIFSSQWVEATVGWQTGFYLAVDLS